MKQNENVAAERQKSISVTEIIQPRIQTNKNITGKNKIQTAPRKTCNNSELTMEINNYDNLYKHWLYICTKIWHGSVYDIYQTISYISKTKC